MQTERVRTADAGPESHPGGEVAVQLGTEVFPPGDAATAAALAGSAP